MFLRTRTESVGIPDRPICGAMIFCIIMCVGSTISAQDPVLRISEPVNSIIADLKTYIPSRMSEADIPGLSIALIRNNQIAWKEGFGVTNRLTGRSVTPETVFEVASISKVITAYIALRLVDQGRLSLDEPVNVYLKKPWLPPSQYTDLIAMRHLLSHSSGLGDDVLFMDKAIRFKPGSSFLYSGMGFLYAQHVIEQVTDSSLEEVARELVFMPLGMPNSNFTAETSVMAHMANGHMYYSLLLLSFLIPFTVILIVSCVVILPANRAITGSWRPSRRFILITGVLVFILTELLLYLVIGKAFPNLIGINIVCALVFLSGMILSLVVGRRLASLLSPSWQRKGGLMTILSAVWMVMASIILLGIAGSFMGPVPTNTSMEPSAIGSLRASAPDLATFLIELASPRYLSAGIHAQIGSVQVPDNQDFSWGLGIGIQHSTNGDALWQNGITFAFRGVMVIYPNEGHGVVVLTNSASGLPVAYDVAERALGGKARWKYF